MKKLFFLIPLICSFQSATAQYDINSWNYGLTGIKNLGSAKEFGVGARIEYAMNCSTTFIGEYNRSLIFDTASEIKGYNELAVGVNLILFNWYPTMITAGMGYIGNDSSFFEQIEEDAYLSFRTGKISHGAQIKLRALYPIGRSSHIFAELNIKSLGRRYDTFLIGFNYDFY